ncbi:MAG: (Fe-S)-binding protein, partial [Thermodesulfobacteriota bacterium]
KQLTAQKTLASPFLLKYFGNITKKLTELPQESGLLQKLTVFTPKLPSLSQPAGQPGPANKKKGEINYFSGCLANYLVPDIKEATINLVRQAGRYGCRTNEGQTCCGLVSYTAGRIEQAQKTARLNIEAFEDNNYPILTSCASCYFHLRSYPDILSGDPVWVKKARLFSERLRELSCFMVEEIPENFSPRKGERIRVAIHDPCHLRFGREKITEPPRQLIRKAGNITLLEIPERCCGHGGLFQMKYPELSHKIADKKIKDLSTALPHYLLTTCSGCLLQLNRAAVRSGLPIKTCHLSVFINHFL